MRLSPRPLLLSAASALIALGLTEAVLALFAPVAFRRPPDPRSDTVWRELLHQAATAPGLPYELRPGAHGSARGAEVQVNALGMRDAMPRADDPARLRVAVLGDSFTFGFGVAVEQTYPARLETLLVRDPELSECDVDVLNFGVSGYNTLDEAALLEARVLRLRPDAIVVGYVLNDPQLQPIQPLQTHFAPVRWWQRSNLLRLVAQARVAFDQKRHGDGDFFEYLHSPQAGFWPKVEAAFSRMAEAGAALHAPVVLVLFPIVPDGDWAEYRYGPLHDRVRASATARGLRVLDLLPVFSRQEPVALRLDAQDEHPTPFGHALAAEALAAALKPDLRASCESRR